MSSKRGQGRRKFTVDALFEDTSPRASGVRDLVEAKEINIERITPDPEQPRQSFDEEALAELAESIRREGVLQPIAVRYDESSDQYVIIHGERRWRAAKAAGLSSMPALVRDIPAERRLLHQLMENVVREDLNAVDRAAALRGLKKQMDDAPWERVAEAVGIRRSRLFQLLSTEKLTESVQQRIRSGELSEKQTRPLQGLSLVAQATIAGMLVAGDLTDTEVRDISRQLRSDPSYLELDDRGLVARVNEIRAERDEGSRPERAPKDPLRQALGDLFDKRSLPDDTAQALDSLARDSSDDADLLPELQRVAVRLGRYAVQDDGSDPGVSRKQLRALRRMIDLALEKQKRR